MPGFEVIQLTIWADTQRYPCLQTAHKLEACMVGDRTKWHGENGTDKMARTKW